MQEVITLNDIARMTGAAILKKAEIKVDAISLTFLQVVGYSPENLRVMVYVIEENGLTNVRATFPGNQGLAFEFKLFSDETTKKRVQRNLDYYMEKHDHHCALMALNS